MRPTRTFFFILANVVTVILGILYGAQFPTMSNAWRVTIAIGLVVLLVMLEYEKARPSFSFQEKFTSLLESFIAPKHDQWKSKDNTLRINVMRLDRYLPSGPIIGRFTIVYSRGMRGATDHGLKLWAWQGVCGDAAYTGKFFAYYLEDKPQPTFRMSLKQRAKTANLTFVASMPIKKAKKGEDGELEIEDKVIGVINVDSAKKDAKAFYCNGNLQDIESSLTGLSQLCSIMLS